MKRILLLHILVFFALCAKAQLRINEIMQSNIDCVFDELNQFPDSWVELHNPSTTATENLGAYKIGLTDDPSKAYQLKYKVVGNGAYCIVYCDKEAKDNHTDFRLESEKGGSLYLFKDNVIVDKLENIPEQAAPNVAYGRKNASSDEWGWQKTPTPAAANCGTLCKGVLGNPVFSAKGRVSSSLSTIRLQLYLPEDAPEGTVIRFTTDGSEPTESSELYGTHIWVRTTKIIRARLFCDGYISPRSVCESFISHDRDVTLPVVSIVTDNAYFYDNKKGIYVDGTYSSDTKNYQYDWRRPINFEYFANDEEPSVINQLGETRVSGAASRSCQVKSLTVYAHKRFGKKRLKYEFFPTQRPGLDKFKSILLRNSGNDFDYLYMRDAAIQRSVAEHADLDWQAWQPAIFYLNGKYMGMLNVRERSTDDNIWANYDGLEDIDMIENGYDLKAGDWQAFNEFRDFYMASNHTYAEYDERMDINEYQNLMLMDLYYSNLDFPGNNIVQWRPREEGSKWRWVAKDTDFGLGLYGASPSYNTIAWLYDNNYDADHAWANKPDATRLFRRLMDIEQFRWEFLDKVAIYTGTFLSATKVKELLDEMAGIIAYEYPFHRQQINPWWPNYSNELNSAKNYISSRQTYFFNHLIQKYGLKGTIIGSINNDLSASDKEAINVEVNNIPVSESVFNGKFFDGRELKFHGTTNDESLEIKGWEVLRVEKNGSTSTTTYEGPDFAFTPTNLTTVRINAIIGEATGIDEVETTNGLDILYIYDINGRRIPELRKGINIIKYKDGSTRKIEVK